MKAAICTRNGPPEVVNIEERPTPILREDLVLIRIRAATVASGDRRVRSLDIPALYKPMMMLIFGVGKPKQPIFGTELSGEVEAVGKNVSKFKAGDVVFAMTGM